jgi:site-specific recombinase XerD
LGPPGTELPQASRADLEAFMGDLLARRSPSTAATYHKVLRILYAWLEDEGEITASPMAKLRPIIPEQPVPVIPEDGLRRLLGICAGKGFEDRRDTALILLLVDVGPRRAELMGAKVTDLDFDLDVLLVLGKGRRERALPFGRKTALALDRYLRVRARHKDAALPWLWLGLRGRFTAWGLVQMLRHRGEEAGLPGAAPAPAAPHLRAPVARSRWWRDRPDAPGRLALPGHAAPLWRLGRRRARRPRSQLLCSCSAGRPFLISGSHAGRPPHPWKTPAGTSRRFSPRYAT